MLSARFMFLALSATATVSAVALPAAAKCMSGAIWLRTEAPIPTNGRIVVDAFAHSRDILADIDKRNPRLRADKDVVSLVVAARRSGEVLLDQVVLAPARPLRAGTTYALEVDGASGLAGATVQTTSGPDTRAPTWKSAPVLRNLVRTEMGCGPSIQATFAMNVADDDLAGLFADVTVKRKKDGQTTQFFVPIKDGTAVVGRSMCSGAFELAPGVAYELTFAVVDAAGQSAPMPGGPLKLSGPPSTR